MCSLNSLVCWLSQTETQSEQLAGTDSMHTPASYGNTVSTGCPVHRDVPRQPHTQCLPWQSKLALGRHLLLLAAPKRLSRPCTYSMPPQLVYCSLPALSAFYPGQPYILHLALQPARHLGQGLPLPAAPTGLSWLCSICSWQGQRCTHASRRSVCCQRWLPWQTVFSLPAVSLSTAGCLELVLEMCWRCHAAAALSEIAVSTSCLEHPHSSGQQHTLCRH